MAPFALRRVFHSSGISIIASIIARAHEALYAPPTSLNGIRRGAGQSHTAACLVAEQGEWADIALHPMETVPAHLIAQHNV
jgi:hypothetical protein